MQPDSRGQPGLIPGAGGFPAMNPAMQAFLGQQGQIPGMQGHAILAQRLAVLPQGGRGGMAAGNQGYRAQAPMGVMMKPAGRKGGASVKGRKSCNCKNSKCLKLYCECFASGRYCDNCNCLSCFNNKDNEAVRQSAVEAILERNPNAFRPKIQTAEGDTHPQSIRNAPDGTVRHTKGCNCKKSSCLKKYCECFQGGIFCTEICKCVDCKNFDGSEARAQVISHHGDPFGMHAAAAVAAAQQQARQRPPRLQMQQQANLQTSLMQQQLAAGAQHAAGLQHLQALTGLGLPGHTGLQTSASLAAVPAAAALTPAGSTAAALPQLPVRPPISDAIHGLVKPELVEEITSLLLIVAKEEADKLAARQQQQQQEAAGLSSSTAVIKAEPTDTADGSAAAAAAAAPADAALCNGVKRKRGSGDGAGEEGEDGPAAAKRAHTGDTSGGGGEGAAAMEEDGQQQQQQHAQNGVEGAAGEGQPQWAGRDLYGAQEGVVLQEFNAILQRILAQAEKKTATDAEAAVAAAAAAAAAVAAVDGAAVDAAVADQAAAAAAAAAAAVAMFDGLSEGSDPAQQQQQYLQQMVAEQFAQHEQQQEHDAQQQLQQDAKSLGRPQLQQQALAQQALLMQAAAANGNLALLQASRGLYLQNAAQQQQLVPPMPLMQGGGMGVQVPGLRPNAGMQMIQVVAQDGSVHQVPAQALMQLQLAAGGLQQQQQLSAAAAAAQGAAGQHANAAGGVSAAPAAQQQQPVSLLSLLNGTGTTSGNSP